MRREVLLTLLGLLAAAGTQASERKPYTRNVAIVVYENAQPLDWVGPYEVYHDAASFGAVDGAPAFDVYLVSKTAATVDAQGMRVTPTYSIENAPRPDIVVFPGGSSANVHADPAFFAWAGQAAREAEIAQSVCTGAYVLGKAGLLDGLEATTHYGSIEGLQAAAPRARVTHGRRFVDNGRVVTTAGISAGIDGSLHVVARLLGRRVADEVAAYMEYHWTPEPFLARQYAYLNPSTDARGRRMQTGEMQLEEKSYAAAEATFRELLEGAPRDGRLWDGLALALEARNDHAGAGQAHARAADAASGPRAAYGYYHAAREYALADRADEAVEMLGKAFAAGFRDREAVEREPALAKLRADPRVRQLVASRQAQ